MMPTTTALMPSSARYTVAYFFRFDQIGKKKSTSSALGKKMATAPITHPNTCIAKPMILHGDATHIGGNRKNRSGNGTNKTCTGIKIIFIDFYNIGIALHQFLVFRVSRQTVHT